MSLDSISFPGKFNFLAWGTFQTELIPFVVNSLVFPICFRGASVVFLWFQFYGGHPRIYCNPRPGFSDLIGQFESTCSNTNVKFTVPCTLSRVHVALPPQTQNHPSADRFQYHAWGSDIRPGSWMRSGDDTRVHNDIIYYCGNKTTSSRPPETVQWHKFHWGYVYLQLYMVTLSTWYYVPISCFLLNGTMTTLFLAFLSLHHRPSLCSCPTAATRKSPRCEKASPLIKPC